jgi:hypothetical protein
MGVAMGHDFGLWRRVAAEVDPAVCVARAGLRQ